MDRRMAVLEILVGTGLVVEHIITYGGLELWDITGHETIGLLLFLDGFRRGIKFKIENPIAYTRKKWGWRYSRLKNYLRSKRR